MILLKNFKKFMIKNEFRSFHILKYNKNIIGLNYISIPFNKFYSKMEPNTKTEGKTEEKPKTEEKTKVEEKVVEKKVFAFDETDALRVNYGYLPFIQSQGDPKTRFENRFESFWNVDEVMVEKSVSFRARIQSSRVTGNRGFLVLRDNCCTFQAIISVGENVSKQMIKFVKFIPIESLVDVKGVVKKAQQEIKSCSIHNYELELLTIFIVSQVQREKLPFQLEDAQRKIDQSQEEGETDEVKKEESSSSNLSDTTEQPKETKELSESARKKEKAEKREKKGNEKKESGEKKDIIIKMGTKLDNRVFDLRVNTTNALMKLQSGVCFLFRDYLYKHKFIEIHTPKLIGGASEGGTNVFTFKYFNTPGCLAQSPQLYKQMAVIGDLPRVMEIGSVFRAENSNTPRHLCEFMGLDIEMTIQSHYYEVLDILHGLFIHIFEGLNSDFKTELDIIHNQYAFEPIKYTKEPLILDFYESCKWLEETGVKVAKDKDGIYEDFDTPTEKALGNLVKLKYESDFYILKRYPKSARPFYTMPDPFDDNYTNSYDAFVRGEEILSGAQRIHDHDMLLNKVKAKGINPETLKDYIKAFELGAPPHGGAGIGLERVVKLFVGLLNVKKCSMFPRDPKRLTP